MREKMRNLSVIGAQWGDEGKGKVVDLYAPSVDMVVRFGGGNNAGHTLVVDGRKLVVHLLPSGVIHPKQICLLGDGMVIDPAALLEEMSSLSEVGVQISPQRLQISGRAHLVLEYHKCLDGLREQTKGALGTTRRGIGPAYEDKAARRGLRVCDLLRPKRLGDRLLPALEEANHRIGRFGGSPLSYENILADLLNWGEKLAPYIVDGSVEIHRALSKGQSVLFEGAQGIMLDIDRGTYPFVTSSTTLAGGVWAGAGVSCRHIGTIVGVAKAYVTRVGEGPFPTEILGAKADEMRALGHEYGATTGRPRRCGWLDLPALRYAVLVGGLDYLALTKLDVLAQMSSVRICTAYRLGGELLDIPPMDPDDFAAIEPIYKEIPSLGSIREANSIDDLGEDAKKFIKTIEQEIGIPVCLVSWGPSRNETIIVREF